MFCSKMSLKSNINHYLYKVYNDADAIDKDDDYQLQKYVYYTIIICKFSTRYSCCSSVN